MIEDSVIQFSGGRTSGYMLHQLLEKHAGTLPLNWKVCFENTGKEREETLEFIHEVEERWSVPIIWLEFDDYFDINEYLLPDGTFRKKKKRSGVRYKIVDFRTASRKGEPFLKLLRMLKEFREVTKNQPPVLPNPHQRICTAYLKCKTCNSYLRDQGFKDFDVYMGIRADEQHRAVKLRETLPKSQHLQVPLIDRSVTKAHVNGFWKMMPFDLQLDPNSDEGNCDLCYLKATGKLIQIMRKDRSRENWWKAVETEFNGNFSKSKLTFHQLSEMIDNNDPRLEKYIKSPIDKTIDCFCGE